MMMASVESLVVDPVAARERAVSVDVPCATIGT
jgi:hypothetical protein